MSSSDNSTTDQQFPFNSWPEEGFQFVKSLADAPEFHSLGRYVNSKTFISNAAEVPKSLEEVKKFESHWFLNKKDRVVQGITYFGSNIEGPPNCVHGGASATICDALSGTVTWACGLKAVTLNLNVNYRKFLPLSTVTRVEAKIDKIDGKKIYVSSSIKSLDGSVTHVEATALFYDVGSK